MISKQLRELVVQMSETHSGVRIARELGMSQSSVSRILCKAGVTRRLRSGGGERKTPRAQRPVDGCPLTSRQLEILRMAAIDAMTYGQIAHKLGLTVSTVRSHLSSIYGSLGEPNQARAILRCVQEGWLALPDAGPLSREAMFLRVCAATLRRSHDLLRARELREGITPAMKRYLRAFDSYLRAQDDTVAGLSRSVMLEQLGLVLEQAGVTPEGRQRPEHSIRLRVQNGSR